MAEEIINLLDDQNFKSWILSPNESSDNYWNNILRDNPERSEAVNKAGLILKALDKEFAQDFPDNEVINRMLRKILGPK